jgi:signal transduction histidine kinase
MSKEEKNSLEELVDLDELQSIQDSFAKTVGTSSVIFSPEGEPLTQFSNPTGFCSLIQSTEEGKRRCFQSFIEMSKKAVSLKEQKILYCFAHGGHFVAPIIIHGEHKGTMFAGQFIPQEFSDEQLTELRRIAEEINIDPELLIKEAKRMRVVEEERVRKYSSLLFQIVCVIARIGSQAAELNRAKDKLQKARDELEIRVQERTAELAQRNKSLEEANRKLEEQSKELRDMQLATLNLAEDLDKARKEAEKAKAEIEEMNKKLERSNRELQDFAYIASHDLREPMRKISAFGELLQASLKGKLNEDEEENFAFMIDGANRMQQMIDDLLTYSRVTTQAKPAKRVDLNKVIEDLKNVELAVLLEETGGTIHVPEPLLSVMADPTQVHQLLQNLIANGLKFHRPEVAPEITVRSMQENKNMVRVEVEDNGIGIDATNYDKIFGMFQRLHSRADYRGTGIGLAVCKKIVERHGGTIGVNSVPGKGSMFWFTMPTTTNDELRNARNS